MLKQVGGFSYSCEFNERLRIYVWRRLPDGAQQER